MKYTLLGKSDLRVSRVGFGCMSLPTDQKESEKLVLGAIDLGINFFDTADLYEKGENEARLGRIIGERRQDLVLATKVGNQWRTDGESWDWNPTKNYILKAVDESLRRLETDYIDLYQLHGGVMEDPIDETIEAFEILKQQGKILHYGISSIRPNVIREYVQRSAIRTVMTQYSLLDRRPEETILDLLDEKEIGVLARGSVAQGLLLNKEPKPYLGYSGSEVKDAADAIEVASNSQRNKAQTALLFALKRCSVAIVGIRTEQHLQDAGSVFDVPLLTEDELSILNKILKPNTYTQHR